MSVSDLSSLPTLSGIVESEGERAIPASVRADGSVRKAIRVKPGYTPPEDVGKYRPPKQLAHELSQGSLNGSTTPDGKFRLPANGPLMRTQRSERKAGSVESEDVSRTSSPAPAQASGSEASSEPAPVRSPPREIRPSRLFASALNAATKDQSRSAVAARVVAAPVVEPAAPEPLSSEPVASIASLSSPALTVDTAKRRDYLAWNLETARLLDTQARSGQDMLPEAQARIDSIPSLEAQLARLSV